jgi:hypothetical protein
MSSPRSQAAPLFGRWSLAGYSTTLRYAKIGSLADHSRSRRRGDRTELSLLTAKLALLQEPAIAMSRS